jgi:hypothetical protein
MARVVETIKSKEAPPEYSGFDRLEIREYEKGSRKKGARHLYGVNEIQGKKPISTHLSLGKLAISRTVEATRQEDSLANAVKEQFDGKNDEIKLSAEVKEYIDAALQEHVRSINTKLDELVEFSNEAREKFELIDHLNNSVNTLAYHTKNKEIIEAITRNQIEQASKKTYRAPEPEPQATPEDTPEGTLRIATEKPGRGQKDETILMLQRRVAQLTEEKERLSAEITKDKNRSNVQTRPPVEQTTAETLSTPPTTPAAPETQVPPTGPVVQETQTTPNVPEQQTPPAETQQVTTRAEIVGPHDKETKLRKGWLAERWRRLRGIPPEVDALYTDASSGRRYYVTQEETREYVTDRDNRIASALAIGAAALAFLVILHDHHEDEENEHSLSRIEHTLKTGEGSTLGGGSVVINGSRFNLATGQLAQLEMDLAKAEGNRDRTIAAAQRKRELKTQALINSLKKQVSTLQTKMTRQHIHDHGHEMLGIQGKEVGGPKGNSYYRSQNGYPAGQNTK